LGGDGDDQIDERGRDDAEGDDAGDVEDGRVDPSAGNFHGVAGTAEHRRKDHEEQDGQGESEELGLAVAKEGSKVVTELVQRHADHGAAVGLAFGPTPERGPGGSLAVGSVSVR
jgi:hypothetical protein